MDVSGNYLQEGQEAELREKLGNFWSVYEKLREKGHLHTDPRTDRRNPDKDRVRVIRRCDARRCTTAGKSADAGGKSDGI